MFRASLTLVVVLGGIVATACSSGESPIANPGDERFTQRAVAGEIEVLVSWLGSDDDLGGELAGYPLDRFLLFEVRLDTHSGDLSSIDLVKAARFLADGAPRQPEEWISTSDDSHHRSGVLVFSRDAVTGGGTLSLDLGSESVEFGWDEAPD